jgi:hypothetical protein
VTDAAEREKIVAEACTNFRTTALPQLVRLGICAPA